MCAVWVPLVKRNVYSDSRFCVSKMDWLGFSFSSGDLWHIFSISSTNRLSFFKLYFCSCKSAVRLENQPCYNSFKFTGVFLSHIWKPLWNALSLQQCLLTEVLEKVKNKMVEVWKLYPIPQVFTASTEQNLPREQVYTEQRWLVQWLFGFFIIPDISAAVSCPPPSSQHLFFVKEQ